MRAFMAAAPVGDEQISEDPIVNELQDLVADLTGKEESDLQVFKEIEEAETWLNR